MLPSDCTAFCHSFTKRWSVLHNEKQAHATHHAPEHQQMHSALSRNVIQNERIAISAQGSFAFVYFLFQPPGALHNSTSTGNFNNCWVIGSIRPTRIRILGTLSSRNALRFHELYEDRPKIDRFRCGKRTRSWAQMLPTFNVNRITCQNMPTDNKSQM